MVSSSNEQAVRSAAGGNVESIAMVQLFESDNNGGWNSCNFQGCAALVDCGGCHIIKIIDVANGNYTGFEQELYPGMDYNSQSSFFHYFEVDDTVVGLNFGSENEANDFSSAVRRSIPRESSTAGPPQPSPGAPRGPPPPMSSPPPSQQNVDSPISPRSQPAPAQSTSSLNVNSNPNPPPSKSKSKKKGFFSKVTSDFVGIFSQDAKEPDNFVLSGPSGFRHESHIGWDPENGFDVNNIPAEWRKLFRAAGVKKSELTDAHTAKFIMQTVTEAMAEDGSGGAPPPPPPPGGPPPPPAGGPPPPPPPPGPPPPTGGPPPPGGAPRAAGGGGQGGDLLSQIQQGTTLKKVEEEEPDLKALDSGKQANLANTLAAAMAARRGGLSGEQQDEEDEWDDDWD